MGLLEMNSILIIPGFGGTVLCNGDLWPTPRGLPNANEIAVPDDSHDTSATNFSFVVSLLNKLTRRNASIFPYDWRLPLNSPQIHADLANRLKAKHTVVITYGLGGILLLSFLHNQKYQDISHNIAKWVAVGCPFQGTNDYIRAMLFGPNPGARYCRFDENFSKVFCVCSYPSFFWLNIQYNYSIRGNHSSGQSLQKLFHTVLSLLFIQLHIHDFCNGTPSI